MIKVENLKMEFGKELLFDSVTFNINRQEKIGLIGRNGSGKTTLFNLLSGRIKPEAGQIIIPKNYNIGYVKQTLEFTEKTVINEAMLGLPEEHRTEKWKTEKILSGLGFSQAAMQKSPTDLSGGYQIRLNLAKVLVSEPDLFLLDEPNNYLDIVSIRWLTRYLQEWKKELMIITHDRSFMDNIITHTMIIHRKKIKKIHGDTSKMYQQIAKEEETYEKTRLNDEKKRKEIEIFINRFRAKARLANSVQSRVKSLKKRIKIDKLQTIENLEFSFNYSPLEAKILMDITGLTFDYNKNITKPLINNIDLTIRKKDRICIIGQNGKGKSTLIRLFSGELNGMTGHIKAHPKLAIGTYNQINVNDLNPDNLIVDEIMYNGPADCDRQTARNICGSMLFSGDAALKKIKVLSGGEKSRVLLGKVLIAPFNLLLLDEPTNHLDMESCDSLISAIDNFPGAIVMVTHNEMLLNAIADKLIVFDKNEITSFDGSYQEFLEKKGWGQEENQKYKKKKSNKVDTPNKKDIRKMRAELITGKSRIMKPLENKISEYEEKISILENKIETNNQEIIKASQNGDGNLINKYSRETHNLQQELDKHYHLLEEKLSEQEYFEKEFELKEKTLLD